MTSALDTIVIEPKNPANTAIIWLHGLGADGHDFEPIVNELTLNSDIAARFIFPHAPIRPVTINMGMPMRAWYDIAEIRLGSQEDETGIRESQKQIESLIQQQLQSGITSDRIIIAGFSQGGAIALHTGLRFPEKLAGILGLSTYLPIAYTAAKERHENNQHTPIMLAHGTHDPVIPLHFAELSKQQLTLAAYSVAWHTYPVEHGLCAEEIAQISQWINTVLG